MKATCRVRRADHRSHSFRSVWQTLRIVALAVTLVAPIARAAQPSANRASYADRYGVLEERNMFMRDRTQKSVPPSATTQPAAARSAEESLVLTGVALEEDGLRAYVEDTGKSTILKLAPGDVLGHGNVGEILIDAIAYDTSAGRTWVEVGDDLRGQASMLLSNPTEDLAAATQPVVASDVANLNPNDPNLTIEQKMKLKRAQELKSK